jgi:hypothetical protein
MLIKHHFNGSDNCFWCFGAAGANQDFILYAGENPSESRPDWGFNLCLYFGPFERSQRFILTMQTRSVRVWPVFRAANV